MSADFYACFASQMPGFCEELKRLRCLSIDRVCIDGQERYYKAGGAPETG